MVKEGLTLGKIVFLNVLQCFIGFGVFDQSDVFVDMSAVSERWSQCVLLSIQGQFPGCQRGTELGFYLYFDCEKPAD